MLRAYLEYAASGGKRLDTHVVSAVPLNDFEQSVHDVLVSRTLTVVPQLGTSRYRIDLVAMHPSQPGKPVLAIECDGASYHASPTARDRDRLRQQHLEALGWTFHRIWSTDWFLRRDEEIERMLLRYRKAVRRSDGPPDSLCSVMQDGTLPDRRHWFLYRRRAGLDPQCLPAAVRLSDIRIASSTRWSSGPGVVDCSRTSSCARSCSGARL